MQAIQTETEKDKQKKLLKTYQDINRKEEEDETAVRASLFGYEYMNLHAFPIDLNALGMMTKEESEKAQSVVFFKEGMDIRVGTLDPKNQTLLDFVTRQENKQSKVKIYYISQASYKETFALFSKVFKTKAEEVDVVEITDGINYRAQIANLNNPSADITATKILETILGTAQEILASDIHIEPEDQFVKVRFRMDGVLQDFTHIPKSYQHMVLSRLKILSKMKLNVEDMPQDGRFTFQDKGKLIDVRVSVLPSAYGEGVVMRLLGTQAKALELVELGMNEPTFKIISTELNKPNGMVITTGPTGSGKTTTLYAFLNYLNEPGVKIITLEDPVEYKLEGISQTPIASDKGMTFAAGLRAILRQDPDVIMVGEIRDQETADVALQAALTGHVVLSTLHTNDAAGAIPRLTNMGVKPYTIAPAMNAIIAQRLVRKLCESCKEETQLDPSMLTTVKTSLAAIPAKSGISIPTDLHFYHSKGCEVCHSTGYKGRIGIYEVISKTEEIEKMIFAEADASEIKKTAIGNGMVTMMQDGLIKALQGITDVEEVLRVAQD